MRSYFELFGPSNRNTFGLLGSVLRYYVRHNASWQMDGRRNRAVYSVPLLWVRMTVRKLGKEQLGWLVVETSLHTVWFTAFFTNKKVEE